MSDLHVGSPFRDLDKLKDLVAATNAEKPDLIVILGDFVIQGVVGGRFVGPDRIADVLAGLQAPLGVVAVLGNHDWWFAKINDTDPVLVLMHNPDLFPNMPARVSLSLAGHTHGGQVNLPILGRPVVPSKFEQRYAYGLVEEHGRKLFITGGVGTSIFPVRFRVAPEIVILSLLPQ